MKINAYKILAVAHDHPETEIGEVVQGAILKGWQPYGPPQIYNEDGKWKTAQAVVIYGKPRRAKR